MSDDANNVDFGTKQNYFRLLIAKPGLMLMSAYNIKGTRCLRSDELVYKKSL